VKSKSQVFLHSGTNILDASTKNLAIFRTIYYGLDTLTNKWTQRITIKRNSRDYRTTTYFGTGLSSSGSLLKHKSQVQHAIPRINRPHHHYQILKFWNIYGLYARGVFRPRQTRQMPRAVDFKGRLLSCQSY